MVTGETFINSRKSMYEWMLGWFLTDSDILVRNAHTHTHTKRVVFIFMRGAMCVRKYADSTKKKRSMIGIEICRYKASMSSYGSPSGLEHSTTNTQNRGEYRMWTIQTRRARNKKRIIMCEMPKENNVMYGINEMTRPQSGERRREWEKKRKRKRWEGGVE